MAGELTPEQQAVVDGVIRKREQSSAAAGTLTPEQQRAVDSVMSQRPPDQRPATWGETGKDVAKSLGAGALRGTAGLADLPGDLTQLLSAGSKYLTGYETPSFDTSFREGMGDLTGGFSERKPQTTLGRYAGTIGEFAPGVVGAALTGGGSLGAQALRVGTKLGTQAVIPGAASEALGQMTEGTDYEPYARFTGALAGGFGANILENGIRRSISPGGGAAAEDLAHAARLRDAGIEVSAGQATKNPRVMAIEANNPALQSTFNNADNSPQLMDFTETILKEAGLTEDIVARAAANPGIIGSPRTAQPQVISELRAANSAMFDDALNGVNVTPLRSLSQPIYDAIDLIKKNEIPSAPYQIRQAGDILSDAVTNGRTVPATDLNRIRSALGDHMSSDDANIRSVAKMTRDALDELIESATNAMGEPARTRALLEARRRYQALLVIDRSLKTETRRGANGIITPADLAGGVAAVYGKSNLVSGDINNAMGDLAQSGLHTITDLGKSTSSGFRSALPFAELGGGIATGLGATQGAMLLGVPPSVAAIAAGVTTGVAAIDSARRAARGIVEKNANRPSVQNYLQNQLVNPSSGMGSIEAGIRSAAYGTPSMLDDRQGRKSGGRVSSHDAAADQLVRAAERARKGQSAQTQVLLNQSDDAVASALEIANRSI